MGLRIKNEIKRLTCSLIYMVAMFFCPAMRKQDAQGDKELGAYREPQAGDVDSVTVNSDASSDGAVKGAFTVFGKVINSLPASFQYIRVADVFIYQFKYQDVVQEFARPGEEREASATRYIRQAEGSVKRGFDLLRLTLNLARGDLEAASPTC